MLVIQLVLLNVMTGLLNIVIHMEDHVKVIYLYQYPRNMVE